MSDQPSTSPAWWGDFTVPHESAGCWHIGPMALWIERLRGEWRVATSLESELGDPPLPSQGPRVEIPAPASDLLAHDTVQRFGLSGESGTIRLTPLLADRDVVTSPETPFSIPPNDRVTIYVGSPLWLRIESIPSPESKSSKALLLCEMPIVRPSDTWFGPTPYRGELCYASFTFCRLRLDDVIVRPNRAVTAVTVSNRSEAPFLLERLRLPVVYLPLYCDGDGTFWTGDLSLEYQADEDRAQLRQSAREPAHANQPTLVAPARQEAKGNLAVRVFSSLFSD